MTQRVKEQRQIKKNRVCFRDRRYLMCAGSILTGRHVLTSASCIHEATHVRWVELHPTYLDPRALLRNSTLLCHKK